MPNECQKPNAEEIDRQHHIAIQLYVHMVIMIFGFTWHLIRWILSSLSGATRVLESQSERYGDNHCRGHLRKPILYNV